MNTRLLKRDILAPTEVPLDLTLFRNMECIALQRKHSSRGIDPQKGKFVRQDSNLRGLSRVFFEQQLNGHKTSELRDVEVLPMLLNLDIRNYYHSLFVEADQKVQWPFDSKFYVELAKGIVYQGKSYYGVHIGVKDIFGRDAFLPVQNGDIFMPFQRICCASAEGIKYGRVI